VRFPLTTGCPGSHCSGDWTTPSPQFVPGLTGFDEAATEVGTVPIVGEFDFVPDGEPLVLTPGTDPVFEGDAPNERDDVAEPVKDAAGDPVDEVLATFETEATFVLEMVFDIVRGADAEGEIDGAFDAEFELETDPDTLTVPDPDAETVTVTVPDPELEIDPVPLFVTETVTDPLTLPLPELEPEPDPEPEPEPDPVPVPVKVGVAVCEIDCDCETTTRAKKARNLRRSILTELLLL